MLLELGLVALASRLAIVVTPDEWHGVTLARAILEESGDRGGPPTPPA